MGSPLDMFLQGLNTQGGGNGFPAPTPGPDMGQLAQDATSFTAPQEPVPEDQYNWKNRLLASVADAIGGYASTVGGFPQMDSVSGRLREQRRRREDVIARNKQMLTSAEGESKRGKAKLDYEKALSDEQYAREKEKRPEEERTRILKILRDRGYELDPSLEAIYMATGDIPQPKTNALDPFEEETAKAKLGEMGVVDLTGDIPKQAYDFANTKNQRANTPKTDKEEKDFAGFKSLKELRDAVNDEAQEELKASEAPTKEMIQGEDELGRPYKREQIVNRPSITVNEARRRAMARFKGAEEHLPEYVRPEADKPKISIEDVRKRLKAK